MDEAKIGLTIFLLREDQVASFKKQIADKHSQKLSLSAPLNGTFLPFPSTAGTPPWVGAVMSLFTNPLAVDMAAKSPGGLLVMEEQGRTFVITFGHAWQQLEDRWLENDFGLRVALNVIPKGDLLEIKSEQVFAKWHLASERAPRASSVEEFGVDFDRDLVAVIEGVPRARPSLGSKVRGSTSLHVKLPIGQLQQTLTTALADFASDAYKKDWPEIDKVHRLGDEAIIQILEEQLDADLRDEKARKKIVMFTPSQRRGESVLADSYVYGRLADDAPRSPFLTIDGLVGALGRKDLPPSVCEAKKLAIHLLDEDASENWKCTAFDCFGYEYSDRNRVYILSSGIWYEVVPDFIERINSTISGIAKPKVCLLAWNKREKEPEYSARCALDGNFLNCDRKIMHYGGGQSQFEFCDLLHTTQKSLFFAKVPSKSTGMSHLIEQVRRTTELLFDTDAGYRNKLSNCSPNIIPRRIQVGLANGPATVSGICVWFLWAHRLRHCHSSQNAAWLRSAKSYLKVATRSRSLMSEVRKISLGDLNGYSERRKHGRATSDHGISPERRAALASKDERDSRE